VVTIGAPMEMSTTPGRLTKALRGQQRAEVTATGMMGTPHSTARRAPLLW
jgi:hypothetical protein